MGKRSFPNTPHGEKGETDEKNNESRVETLVLVSSSLPEIRAGRGSALRTPAGSDPGCASPYGASPIRGKLGSRKPPRPRGSRRQPRRESSLNLPVICPKFFAHPGIGSIQAKTAAASGFGGFLGKLKAQRLRAATRALMRSHSARARFDENDSPASFWQPRLLMDSSSSRIAAQ